MFFFCRLTILEKKQLMQQITRLVKVTQIQQQRLSRAQNNSKKHQNV